MAAEFGFVGFAVGSGLTWAASKFARDDGRRKRRENAAIKNTDTTMPIQQQQQQRTSVINTAATISTGIRIGFISDLLRQLWSHLSVAIGQQIKASVEPIIAATLPYPMNGIKFKKCDLGQEPLQLENIFVHDMSSDSRTVQIDMDIVWDGHCHIELQVPVIGALGVNKLKFMGRLQFIMRPLTDTLPCVSAVQFAFVNPPTLEFGFTGLAKIAQIRPIQANIGTVIDQAIAEQLVLPNQMYAKIDKESTYFDAYHLPLGIARIQLMKGRGFCIKKKAILTGKQIVPDVYCNVSFSLKTWKTDYCTSIEPKWNDQVADFIMRDYDQIINIEVFDEDNEIFDKTDDFLGQCSITIGEIMLAGQFMELPLFEKESNAKTNAFITIYSSILPFTANLASLSFSKLTGEEQHVEKESNIDDGDHPSNNEEEPQSTNVNATYSYEQDQIYVGLVVILITKAFGVPLEIKELETSTCVRVKFGDKEVGVTPTITHAEGVDCLNPEYNKAIHIPLTKSMMEIVNKESYIEFELINNTDHSNVQSLGKIFVGHEDYYRSDSSNHKSVKEETLVQKTKFILNNGDSSNDDDSNANTINDKNDHGNTTCELEYSIMVRGMINNRLGASVSSSNMNRMNLHNSGHEDAEKNTCIRNLSEIELTIHEGWGFPIQKAKGFLRKPDVPDCYCEVKFGSSPMIWRTSVIKNSTEPIWDESKKYTLQNNNQTIHIDVSDDDKDGKSHDYLGSTMITVGKLLLYPGVPQDLQLLMPPTKDDNDGASMHSDRYISISCAFVKSSPSSSNLDNATDNDNNDDSAAAASSSNKDRQVSTAVLIPSVQKDQKEENNNMQTVSEKIDGEEGRGGIMEDKMERKIMLIVHKGWEFEVQKAKGVFQKRDIPDCYCEIKLENQDTDDVWRTQIIKDDTKPIWEEDREYVLENLTDHIFVDVKDDDDHGKSFDYLGSIKNVTLGDLLLNPGIPMDFELFVDDGNSATGTYVQLSCIYVS